MGSITEGMRSAGKSMAESILLKAKMEREERKGQEVLDVLQDRIISSYQKTGKPEDEIAAVAKAIDGLRKSKLSAQEALTVTKAIAPDLFSEKQLGGRILMAGRGGVRQVGEYSPGDKVFEENLTPDEMSARTKAQGEARIDVKEKETAIKLGTAVKRMNVVMKQFDEALPTLDKSAIEQRFSGQIAAWGAKTGVAPNPKLLALLSNARPMAINLIRLFGEVGNLSETEQKGALETVDLKGLTEVERLDKVRQFAEYALAGASDSSLEYLKSKPEIVEVIKNLGLKINGVTDSEGAEQEYDSEKEARYQAWKRAQDNK